MAYSNDSVVNPYADALVHPLPNIKFPKPYWINALINWIIIGCTDPDLAIAEMAIPAAANAAWSLLTPSTKQLIQEATGKSWICGTKQVVSQSNTGTKIAQSDGGRAVYEMAKELDILTYYAFLYQVGSEGIHDWASFVKRFKRVCGGSNSAYRGRIPVGGWPSDETDWQTGPSFSNAAGGLIGPSLIVKRGQIAAMIAWCSFSDLFGTGGEVATMRIRNYHTNEVYDSDLVNNLFSTQQFAIVQWFTNESRALTDMEIVLEVQFNESAGYRAVPVKGGCYIRAWNPTAGDAPPYWNMREFLTQKGLT